MKYLALITLVAGIASSAFAGTWTLGANLNGSQEVPPSGSSGVGSFTATYDDVTKQISSIVMTVTGLTSSLQASHIHQAPAGTNGGVIVNFASFGNWTNTSGFNYSYTQTSPITLTAAQETALLAGGTYINIHTGQFPGGEVRGQISAVPEPATLATLAVGALALLKRRKK